MPDGTSPSNADFSPPPSLSGKTVLITGGAGLVGRRLVTALSPNADVRVLDHFQTSTPSSLPDDTRIYQGDIGDQSVVEEAVDGADIVFHQAATSGPYALDNPLESNEVNVTATLQLLEQARHEDARTVVASSAAIYGPPNTVPVDEREAKNPLNPYGLQKLTADEYTRIFADLYALESVVLRYFNVYGYRPARSRRKNVVNIFIEQALEGSNLRITGDGSQVRDFVHVDDVVQANLHAAVTPHVGEAFNIGSGDGTSIAQLTELVREHAGDVTVTTSEARPTDVDVSVADITSARRYLGYEPTISIREGVSRLWDEYQRRDGNALQ